MPRALPPAPPPLQREEGEPRGSSAAHWSFGTTADVGIGARAPTPSELFAQLGEGLTDLITDLRRVEPRDHRGLEVEATSPEGLVVAYLTELLALFDEEGWLASRFDVELSGKPPSRLKAELRGEVFDPARHPLHIQVKAATLHRLLLDLDRGRARVIVDI